MIAKVPFPAGGMRRGAGKMSSRVIGGIVKAAVDGNDDHSISEGSTTGFPDF